jgi:hypothetical protein
MRHRVVQQCGFLASQYMGMMATLFFFKGLCGTGKQNKMLTRLTKISGDVAPPAISL